MHRVLLQTRSAGKQSRLNKIVEDGWGFMIDIGMVSYTALLALNSTGLDLLFSL